MKTSKTHKHIRIGRNVYHVTRRVGDPRYWDCGSAWGPTAEAAAREYHIHLSDHGMEAKTIAELHERETYGQDDPTPEDEVMSTKLLASSGSFEGIKKLISEYYFGSTITLKPVNKNLWEISTGKGLCKGFYVVNKKGRYRFEAKIEPLGACHGEDQTPEDEDCYISPTGPLGSRYSIACGGKYLCTVSDFNDALSRVNDWQKKNKFWPNIWMVDDHGGSVCIDGKGNEISGGRRKRK